jgi:amino acid permease
VIETVDTTFHKEHDLKNNKRILEHIYMAILVLVVFTPLTWVRNIQKFRFAFILAFLMIIVAVVTTSSYCFDIMAKRSFIRPSGGYYALNKERYWDMIGCSFLMYEGIGCVMPIMNSCDSNAKRNFSYLIAAALLTLCTIYILFSELSYFTFGNRMDDAIIMHELPS